MTIIVMLSKTSVQAKSIRRWKGSSYKMRILRKLQIFLAIATDPDHRHRGHRVFGMRPPTLRLLAHHGLGIHILPSHLQTHQAIAGLKTLAAKPLNAMIILSPAQNVQIFRVSQVGDVESVHTIQSISSSGPQVYELSPSPRSMKNYEY